MFPSRHVYAKFQLNVRTYETGVVYLQYEPTRDAKSSSEMISGVSCRGVSAC